MCILSLVCILSLLNEPIRYIFKSFFDLEDLEAFLSFRYVHLYRESIIAGALEFVKSQMFRYFHGFQED